MKLLVDQNLSRYLLEYLLSIWAGSEHVALLGMGKATDKEIWNFARENGYIIVSKDSDFVQMATLFGAPPKVILLATGNCSTDSIKHCLLAHQRDIDSFYKNQEESLLVIPN